MLMDACCLLLVASYLLPVGKILDCENGGKGCQNVTQSSFLKMTISG
jgi:hypothetical protein